MRPIADHGPLILDNPGVRVEPIDHASGRYRDPELAVPPLLAMRASAVARRHVGRLCSASLNDTHPAGAPASSLSPALPLASTRRRLPSLPHLLRNRTAALRR